MKIKVRAPKPGSFALSFDETHVHLDTAQMKQLLLGCVQAMSGGAKAQGGPEDELDRLSNILTGLSPITLQKLIVQADEDDLLRLLKAKEKDALLHAAIFDNMSERKHTMFAEDLQFRFADGVPDDELFDAIERLEDLIDTIAREG